MQAIALYNQTNHADKIPRSGRRNANRIRGPQSALTDFLAANNISAQQIRDDYENRRQQAEQDAAANGEAQDEQAAADAAEAESAMRATRQERQAQQAKHKKMVKKGKLKAKDKKKQKRRNSDDEDDFSDSESGSESAKNPWRGAMKKAKKLPGQLENCEVCSKRFTVTPYSKSGPDGGLVCTKCGKELAKDAEIDKPVKKAGPTGRKRRKVESDKLDGRVQLGAKSLQQLCIEKVAHHATDVDDLGDLPHGVMVRLSEIFTKKRVMRPKQLRLFLRPDVEAVIIHDCAYLEDHDFRQIFAIIPQLKKLVLGNACQFKNETIDYMIEKSQNLKWLQLYAANLVSDQMWTRLFEKLGQNLETLKLQWLDAAFEDLQVEDIALHCPNLVRLKLERCRRLTPACLKPIAQLKKLQHLSLYLSVPVPNEDLISLLETNGTNLLTLSLQSFRDIDDTVLETLSLHCNKLQKLRITDNDTMTDAGLASFFTNSSNPPFRYIDLSFTRDVDNSNPDGPEEGIGLGRTSFPAMMNHSATKIEYLNATSCRHITFDALTEVFDGNTQYPELKEVELSFVSAVDTLVLAGLFKCAPRLRKVVAFGCFNIEDVVVPQGVVVIGVPRAQDAIERFGLVGVDVDRALGNMVEMFGRDEGVEGFADAGALMDVEVAA